MHLMHIMHIILGNGINSVNVVNVVNAIIFDTSWDNATNDHDDICTVMYTS